MGKVFKGIAIGLGIVLIIYVLATFIVPPIVDKGYNKVSNISPYTISNTTEEIYNSLDFIADLHCDVLLWKRDIISRHDYGHVDIPRMLEANIALQAFTIVSKTPKNMNFDLNTGDTDNITSLYIAQGRPVKSWFSLKERALVQCNSLYEFAEASDGKFRVITDQTNFESYLQKRKTARNITAAIWV